MSHNAGSTQFITFLGVKSSFSLRSSLNYVMISTNNKIRNENPASTGSLTGLKRFFSTFHLSSTRTNQQTCCINLDMSILMQQVRDHVFDKKSRKRVESMSKACHKPARTCRKPGCKPGRKPGLQPGLQLARIMECGLNRTARPCNTLSRITFGYD